VVVVDPVFPEDDVDEEVEEDVDAFVEDVVVGAFVVDVEPVDDPHAARIIAGRQIARAARQARRVLRRREKSGVDTLEI
jgi:hypothetical protein